MTFLLADRVQVTATANTTVSFTLSGAMTSYQSFAAIGNGNTTYYGATDGTNWETGIGTYSTTGPTLTRTTILSSSSSGSAVTFSGTVTVWVDYPASKAVIVNDVGDVLVNQSYDQGTGVLQVTGQSTFNGVVTDKSLNLQGGNNLVLNSATLVTQNITVTANTYTLSMTGTGTITLSGTSSGTLVGTGASTVVSKTFTPTAGTLTLTPTGSCTTVQLELGSVFSGYTATTGTAITTTNNISVPSGQVLLQNGTSSLPSISLGATNNGIYGISGVCTAVASAGVVYQAFNYSTSGEIIVHQNGRYAFGSSGINSADTFLYRDAANTLAQRNSTNAQTFRLYNTYTDASNYERLSIDWSTTANTATIVTQNAGTGSARSLAIGQDLYVNSVRVGRGGGNVSSNLAIGNNVMVATATGSNNVAIGQSALYNVTSGSTNTAIGNGSLISVTTSSGNTGVGYYSLYNNTAVNNTAVGDHALFNNTTGASSVSNGTSSLYYNTTGSYINALGFASLFYNTTASNLTAIGSYSLYNNTTNVATLGAVTGGSSYTNGTYTGVVMTLSSGSTAITYPTATIVVSGGVVTTVTITSAGVGFRDTTTVLTAPAASIGGTGSGFSVPVATLQSGTGNVAVGYQAGYSNSVGQNNTFTGYQAGYSNSTGVNNTFYGNSAGYNTTTGNTNAFYGQATGYANTTGVNNAGFGGQQILIANTTGSGNSAFGGYATLQSNTTGQNLSAFGNYALQKNTTGSLNVAFGLQAGVGNGSANANTTGSNNTYIGYQTVGSANNNTNEMVIGYQAVGLGSNTTVIGNTSTTLTQTYGVTKSTNYTVATLPSASTSGVGARAFVTDALAPSFGVAVTGGGAVPIPVYSTGSAWNVG